MLLKYTSGFLFFYTCYSPTHAPNPYLKVKLSSYRFKDVEIYGSLYGISLVLEDKHELDSSDGTTFGTVPISRSNLY